MAARVTAAVPVFKNSPNRKEVKQMGEVAGAIVGNHAWSAELTHVKTTHGPMDVRIWRRVK
ncbi:MAG: hypothetical protein Q4A65_01080 [Bacillota bacterium]|nr:hypothetical protein [Bacillota bacterium]